MHWLSIVRIAFLSFASLCAIILLGLGAHALAATSNLSGLPTFAWSGLGVATAVLALCTIPAMIAIDLLRTGAFSSLIVVELSWLSFIGILFLATGGSAADRAANFWVSCNTWSPQEAQNLCSETSAAAAFGILGWLALWVYTGILLVFLIIHAHRGHYVWRSTVKEANFGASVPPANTTAPGTYGTEAKSYEAASLNPPAVSGAQPPYAYPPSPAMSPTPTGYGQPPYGQSPLGAPAPTYPSAYPQV
ncbi:hypothetical protein BC628DRAFT_1420343 [Trametes gibbosa]|nr:hypothetical protein BC628DRAFT_1420343 [Trametes gibbosa]